jgi:hypothetical protein
VTIYQRASARWLARVIADVEAVEKS